MSNSNGSSSNGSRARAPVCLEQMEALDCHEPGSKDARMAVLRNVTKLGVWALNRKRSWTDKDGNEREATEPDIPSAIKCQELGAKILLVIADKPPSKGAGDEPAAGPEVEKQLLSWAQQRWPGHKWPTIEELKGKRG